MVSNDSIDVKLIQNSLPANHSCHFIQSVTSTQTDVSPNSLLIAEHQSAGVGRRGNHWLTPEGRSICLSYRFKLALPVAQMSGYQITTAIAIVDTILGFDPQAQVHLKWPNDLYHGGKKFAGILINLIPKQQHTEVIVGVGINWRLTAEQLESVNQAVCNLPLSAAKSKQAPNRSQFICELVKHIDNHNQRFIHNGLSGFLSQWQQHDYFSHKTVQVMNESNQATGTYQGINPQGELLLETEHGIKSFCSGEVSVKAV